ncbi:MAG: hypothetical protein ABEK29_10245, partial [Bradymonadaceae bacterium]
MVAQKFDRRVHPTPPRLEGHVIVRPAGLHQRLDVQGRLRIVEMDLQDPFQNQPGRLAVRQIHRLVVDAVPVAVGVDLQDPLGAGLMA